MPLTKVVLEVPGEVGKAAPDETRDVHAVGDGSCVVTEHMNLGVAGHELLDPASNQGRLTRPTVTHQGKDTFARVSKTEQRYTCCGL